MTTNKSIINKEEFFDDRLRQRKLYDAIALSIVDCYAYNTLMCTTVVRQVTTLASKIGSALIRKPSASRDISCAGIYSMLIEDYERKYRNRSFIFSLTYNALYPWFSSLKNESSDSRCVGDRLFIETEIASRKANLASGPGFIGSFFFISEKNGQPCWATPLKMYSRFFSIRERVPSLMRKTIYDNVALSRQLVVSLKIINERMGAKMKYSLFKVDRDIVNWISGQIKLLEDKVNEIDSLVRDAKVLGFDENSPLRFFEKQIIIMTKIHPRLGKALYEVIEENWSKCFSGLDHVNLENMIVDKLIKEGISYFDTEEMRNTALPALTAFVANRFFHSRIRSSSEVEAFHRTIDEMKKVFPDPPPVDRWLYSKLSENIGEVPAAGRDYFNDWTAKA